MKRTVTVVAALTMLAGQTFAQNTMTNGDVISLVEADMSEDVILSAINGADGGFDTSASALVELKNANVPDNVISAIVSSGSSPSTASGQSVSNAAAFNPETVVARDSSGMQPMRYLTPNVRTASRAFGLGGVAQYAVLAGPYARLRLDAEPVFTVAVPDNAQVQSYITLASFAVRRNDTREVLIGGGSGFGGYSTGIHPDRVIQVNGAPSGDQSGAPDGMTLYEVRPTSPLASGEYAVVLSAGLAASYGLFSGTTDSYFDFGVD